MQNLNTTVSQAIKDKWGINKRIYGNEQIRTSDYLIILIKYVLPVYFFRTEE